MSDIKVKINFETDTQSRIDYDNNSINYSINNVSDMNRLSDKGVDTTPLLFGVSTFADGHTFAEDYNGIISALSMKELLDSGITPTITISGANICALLLDFDEAYGSYIKKVWTSQTGYITNNDYDLLIPLEEITNNVEIKILELNDNSKPIIIRRITSKITKVYKNKNVRNLKLGTEIDNVSSPSYSIIGKYGSFDIIDTDKEFAIFERNGMLEAKSSIEVYYNDNLISKMESKRWKTGNDRFVYSVELTDETYFWNNRYIDKIQFEDEARLDVVFEREMREKNIRLSNNYYNNIKSYFNTFKINNMYTEDRMTIVEFLNSICNISLSSMCINENGELEVIKNV